MHLLSTLYPTGSRLAGPASLAMLANNAQGLLSHTVGPIEVMIGPCVRLVGQFVNAVDQKPAQVAKAFLGGGKKAPMKRLSTFHERLFAHMDHEDWNLPSDMTAALAERDVPAYFRSLARFFDVSMLGKIEIRDRKAWNEWQREGVEEKGFLISRLKHYGLDWEWAESVCLGALAINPEFGLAALKEFMPLFPMLGEEDIGITDTLHYIFHFIWLHQMEILWPTPTLIERVRNFPAKVHAPLMRSMKKLEEAGFIWECGQVLLRLMSRLSSHDLIKIGYLLEPYFAGKNHFWMHPQEVADDAIARYRLSRKIIEWDDPYLREDFIVFCCARLGQEQVGSSFDSKSLVPVFRELIGAFDRAMAHAKSQRGREENILLWNIHQWQEDFVKQWSHCSPKNLGHRLADDIHFILGQTDQLTPDRKATSIFVPDKTRAWQFQTGNAPRQTLIPIRKETP